MIDVDFMRCKVYHVQLRNGIMKKLFKKVKVMLNNSSHN
jgi:hypothetical protein